MKTNEPAAVAAPWWRHGHVWLVIAGPAAVVAAGFVTLGLAVQSADTVLEVDAYRSGAAVTGKPTAANRAVQPALQGRNHAATPVHP